MGHNPTGILLSLERRKALYAVCSKFDVIIVEDDPYWYLQFPSAASEESKSRNRPPVADAFSESSLKNNKSSGYEFLDSLVPSFLSVDVDGRVVRLDTFSKTVAPGCRLGWVTAQPGLIERFVRVSEATTQQPSGFVQSVISELLIGQKQPPEVTSGWLSLRTNKERAAYSGWQTDGWVRWLEGLRGEYERRMNRMCRILDEGSVYVKQGTPRAVQDADVCVLTKTKLYDFAWPRGGMFVWIRIFFENHPLYGVPSSDGADLIDGAALATGLLLYLTRKPHLVLISPGAMFSSTEQVRRDVGWQYVRMCFAAESEENVDLCSQRFVRGVRKYWAIKKVKELEDIIKDSPVAEGNELDEEVANLGLYMGC
ncbi:PLP-dependent transferase [Cryphonectria parasitica EP155]|uniref:PLP-dependent transferase n=1 Tax=Cryphonectria parasitica (strain ATCC 38755 / EP155) TaxID=660469 RepID=A0A9P5CVL3_CRYP1|nr:PLP-dependent transferase [Cryphonectria parasitica EP155]KAF3770765.1 PLP-dependent transferase [Cryphonectria parasitica EP155]